MVIPRQRCWQSVCTRDKEIPYAPKKKEISWEYCADEKKKEYVVGIKISQISLGEMPTVDGHICVTLGCGKDPGDWRWRLKVQRSGHQ